MTHKSSEYRGAELRQLREDLHLTRADVARETGISESTVKRLEATGIGHNLARVERWLRNRTDRLDVASIRDVSEAIKTTGMSEGKPIAEILHEFAARLEGLPPDQQHALFKTFVLTYARFLDLQ